MSHYNNNAVSVRVDFFKESGKWYCTEAVEWLTYHSAGSGQLIDGGGLLIHDAFREALDAHFGDKPRLRGMRAICLDPYHEHSHPISLIV